MPSINQTSDLVQEIAAASKEQSAGASQVNTSMTQMSQITQATASSSEELAATAEETMGQADHLQQLMRFFRTPERMERRDPRRSAARVTRPPAPGIPSQVRRLEAAGLDEAKFDRF